MRTDSECHSSRRMDASLQLGPSLLFIQFGSKFGSKPSQWQQKSPSFKGLND